MKNKIAYTIVRILLGLVFLLSGIIKVFPFLPESQLPEKAMAFTAAMTNTGYFIQFLGIAEMAVGILLLANFWVPFSMMILSPIMLNIVLFNAFLQFSVGGMLFTFVFVFMQAYIMYCTWGSYKPLFRNTIIGK